MNLLQYCFCFTVWFWGMWGLSSLAGGRTPTPALEGEVLAATASGSPRPLCLGFSSGLFCLLFGVWAPAPLRLSLPVASSQRLSLMAQPHPGPLLPRPATLGAPSTAHCDWAPPLSFPRGARAPVSSRQCSGHRPGLAPAVSSGRARGVEAFVPQPPLLPAFLS